MPVEVVAEIDRLVGKRRRSEFLTELAQREIKLRQQRQAIEEAAGAWTDQEHPELSEGAYSWVRNLRSLDAAQENERLDELQRHREER